MAERAGLEVTGLRQLSRSLKALGDKDTARALQKANKAMAEEVVKRALPHVPVRTGRLKRSVKATASAQSATVKAGNRTVKYAAAHEWGTGPRERQRGPHNIKGRRFLHNAAKGVDAGAADRYRTEIDRVIKQAGLD